MAVHLPDESQPCLAVGATELFLRGHIPDGSIRFLRVKIHGKFWIGKWLLLKTDPEDPVCPGTPPPGSRC